jgi:hypothetical protein
MLSPTKTSIQCTPTTESIIRIARAIRAPSLCRKRQRFRRNNLLISVAGKLAVSCLTVIGASLAREASTVERLVTDSSDAISAPVIFADNSSTNGTPSPRSGLARELAVGKVAAVWAVSDSAAGTAIHAFDGAAAEADAFGDPIVRM